MAIAQSRSLHIVDNALVTPTVIDRANRTFTGCVYDGAGEIVRAAQRTSHGVSWKAVDPDRVDLRIAAEEVDGECVYLGHYTSHYGHFLLETLSRFWALESGSDFDRLVFHPFVHPTPRPRSFAPARVALECFDADLRRVTILRRPTRFRRLVLPTALVEINNAADEGQRAVYRRIVARCRARSGAGFSPQRLYLSRRRLNRFRLPGRSTAYRPFTNEGEIEELFGSLGFVVLHPERVPFSEQVALYSRADVVAGYPGSALHNAVFMRPGALLVKIGSLRTRSVGNPNQRMCEELAGVRSEFLRFDGRIVDWDERLGEVDIDQLRVRLEDLLGEPEQSPR